MQLLKTNSAVKPNFLVYGPAGSFKSMAVTTYTKGRIHILQTEPGRISALDNPEFHARVADGTHSIIMMESNQDFELIRRGGPDAYHKFCQRLGLQFPDMIVLDSITWYNTLVIDDIISRFPPRNGLGIPEINHWMMITEQTRQLITRLVQTDAILYIIAQADLKELEEPGLKTTLWLPGITGKYATKITHDVDMVFFAKPASSGEIQLHCTFTGGHLGKTRGINVVGKTIPFNLDKIVDLWNTSIIEGRDNEPCADQTEHSTTKTPQLAKPVTPTTPTT